MDLDHSLEGQIKGKTEDFEILEILFEFKASWKGETFLCIENDDDDDEENDRDGDGGRRRRAFRRLAAL